MNTTNKIKKYYIGLAAIGIFTVIIAILTVVQGASSKQDIETKKSAQKVATSLNQYITASAKIPSSLSDAGIKDVPKTVSYKKDSDSEYTFCVTYKQASSSNLDATSLLYGSGITSQQYSDDIAAQASTYKPSYLYLNTYSYKKGENCQTIQPYLSSAYKYTPYVSRTTPSTGSSSTQASVRDIQRKTRINSMYSKLEEYFNNNDSYPATFTASTLSGIDASALTDPNGKGVVFAKSVSTETAAKAAAIPSLANNFIYVPINCKGNVCAGFVLASYIEVTSNGSTNPYTKLGLNN